MTRPFRRLLLFLLITMTGCGGEYYSDAQGARMFDLHPVIHSLGADTDTLMLNLEASTIAWKGTKLWGRGKHTGTVDIMEGYLLMNKNRVAGGTVVANMRKIEITDIPPDQPEPIKTLTGHLEHEVFFDVEEYPKATFSFTDIQYIQNDALRIRGNLRIKDATKNVAFTAQMDSISKERVLYHSRFKIDRFEWGIAYTGGFGKDLLSPRNFVDRDIELTITLVPLNE